MSITIDLSNQEIDRLKQVTQKSSDSEAVQKAVQEFLRIARLRQLKSVSGKVEYEDRSAELRALDLDDTPFPE